MIVCVLESLGFLFLIKSGTKVNVVCQFGQATSFPDIWSSIILGVSLKAFLNKINISISGL